MKVLKEIILIVMILAITHAYSINAEVKSTNNIQNTIEDQKTVVHEAIDKINHYKDNRDFNLKSLQDNINSLNEKANESIKYYEKKSLDIEEAIATIRDEINNENVIAEENMIMKSKEYWKKLDELNEQNLKLEALMTEQCDDCDLELLNHQILVKRLKIKKEKTELEQNFLKQGEKDEQNLKELNAEKIKAQNIEYSKYVEMLKRELGEYKKKEANNDEIKNVSKEWKTYSENIENLFLKTISNIYNLTNNSLNLNIFTDNDENSNTTDQSQYKYDFKKDSIQNSWNKVEQKKVGFKWVHYKGNNSNFPKNAVLGGNDIDNLPLYVIRSRLSEKYVYGKYAAGNQRNDAYVTDDIKEHGVLNFEILTAKNYTWCSSSSRATFNKELPICRVNIYGLVTPGTLLEDMKCRVGYGYKIEIANQNFEILSFNKCFN